MEEIEKPGDGSEDEAFKTPKSILYFVLSILWIIPSLTTIWMITRDLTAVRQANGLREIFFAIKIEQWIGLLSLMLHGVFIFLAIRCRQRR